MAWHVVRWAGLVAAGAVAVCASIVIFGPVTDLMARHDVGALTGPQRAAALQSARDAARGRLVQLGAGLFAAAALIYTARNFTLSREGHVTDRYTKAVEQLGSDKLDVRIGGIYALERVARDSAKDHPTVMEVLAAFIREHSRERWPTAEPGGSSGSEHRFPRPDVQAAVTVIGRRKVRSDRQRIDLTAAVLPNALLFCADLTGIRLVNADLGHANLVGANFTGVDLVGADLSGADLSDAILSGANLTEAIWPIGETVPDGWQRGRRGRLERANEVSGGQSESNG